MTGILQRFAELGNKITMKWTIREAEGRQADDQSSKALPGMDATCMVDYQVNGFSEIRNSSYWNKITFTTPNQTTTVI